MRAKRSAGSKKATRRSAKARAAASVNSAKKVIWGMSIDRVSMGVAVACMVGAGILVAAYKPSHSVEAAAPPAATSEAAPQNAAPLNARPIAPASAKTSAATAETSSAQWPEPLTITGCLEREADSYRLTDASGVGAPKARSWKSGFLRKNSASIAVIDAERRARLQDYVGQRVSVTGTMINREMQLGTVRPLATSCAQKVKI